MEMDVPCRNRLGHPSTSRRLAMPTRARAVLAGVATMLAALFLGTPAGAKEVVSTADPMTLQVPGYADAYYVQPRGRSRRPIVLYLHGRGGNALEDCRKWARVARQFGWVVCPQGPAPTDTGGRTWNNDAETAKKIIDATVDALKDKYKGRVRTRSDILIGFSEGAFIAQQVGMRDPSRWNRWLILAANDQYWFGDAPQRLEQNRAKIRRVYLLTGEDDQVAENTKRAGEMLKDAHIRVLVKIAPGLGHEVPADRMITNYRRPLRWLVAAM
jgi:predicted esterase